jgi:hypothetical protein
MPCELTIIEGGRIIQRDEMSDPAFIQAIASGWEQGQAVKSADAGYFYLIARLEKPRWNAGGTVQTAPGQIVIERHQYN